MTNSLSIINKQALSQDSNSSLRWEDLDSKDRRIVMANCFEGSPEEARKSLKLSIGGFYKRWKYLKPLYNSLLNDLPNQAVNIMKGYSINAAQALGKNLDAENPSDQIKAANSILDRVTPERDKIQQQGIKRTLTVTEFIAMPQEEIEKLRNN
jgi:hypothetical protein